ncbi:MAG: hypothetical protein BAJALOKI1v1_1170002 [Promethearchaeota archaeon]|nr:MAG: hypothetical protein BAJALOKI1v1_1170002 [Candidatus Lokiarchaeota archaeon]
MSKEKKDILKELFEKWEAKNEAVGENFQAFDISAVKEIRNEQRKIEDEIYSILLESAPANIRKILPEDCGSMELGFESTNQKFYFLMEDPAQAPEEELRILAVTIDVDQNINLIKDFKNE